MNDFRFALRVLRKSPVFTLVSVLTLGLGIGLLASLALADLLSSQLFGVSPRDPTVLLGVVLILAIAGGLASALPAQRATRVDPVEAMRGK